MAVAVYYRAVDNEKQTQIYEFVNKTNCFV